MAKAKALTVKSVEAAKADKDRKEIPDGDMPGLRLVVQPTGAKAWIYRYRFRGQPKKVTLGGYPQITLAGARELARAAARIKAEGRDPAEEKKKRITAEKEADLAEEVAEAAAAAEASRAVSDYSIMDTVQKLVFEFARLYLPKVRSARYRANFGLLLGVTRGADGEWKATEDGGYVLSNWGAAPIMSVIRNDVIAVLDKVALGTDVHANRVLAAIRKLFNWAEERDIEHADPCRKIKRPQREIARDHVINDAELRAIWLASYKLKPSRGPFIRMLMLTMQRRGEVAGMRWSELDIGKKIWEIPGSRTKNGVTNIVPMPDAAMEILRSVNRFEGSDFVFSLTGKNPINDFTNIKKGLDALEPKIREWRLHDLRRTGRTNLPRLGVSGEIGERILNHVLPGIQSVYNRYEYLDEKRGALEKYAQFVESLVVEANAEEVKVAA